MKVGTISEGKFKELLKRFQPGQIKEKETKQETQQTKLLAKEIIDKFTKKEVQNVDTLTNDFTKSNEIMKKVEGILNRCQNEDTQEKKFTRKERRKITIKPFDNDSTMSEDNDNVSLQVDPDENFQCEFCVAEPELEAEI